MTERAEAARAGVAMSGEVSTGNHAASGAGGRKRACRAGRLPSVPGASEPCREDDTLSGAAPISGAGGMAKDMRTGQWNDGM